MASRRRKRVTDELIRFVEESMRRLEIRAYQALTSASPVLTGFFRAGWSPSTGSPRPGPAESPLAARGPRAPLEALARQQAQALFGQNSGEAEAIASTYKLSQGAIFIVNNVSYGVFLNEGSSGQAPAMFVEAAVLTAVRATERELSQRR